MRLEYLARILINQLNIIELEVKSLRKKFAQIEATTIIRISEDYYDVIDSLTHTLRNLLSLFMRRASENL